MKNQRILANGCIPNIINVIMELLVDRNIDGLNALSFLHWLKETLDDISYRQTLNEGESLKDSIYFALYDHLEIDLMQFSDIQYGTQIENCIIPYEAEFFRITISSNDDNVLEKLTVTKEKPMNVSITETLKAYLRNNQDVLSSQEVASLKAQISYMEQKIKDNYSSSPIKLGDISVVVNEDKLKKYLDEGYILEFVSAKECMEHFNEYDYQDFKSVEEMKKYMGRYQFSYKGHYFHINVDEVFDVYTL